MDQNLGRDHVNINQCNTGLKYLLSSEVINKTMKDLHNYAIFFSKNKNNIPLLAVSETLTSLLYFYF